MCCSLSDVRPSIDNPRTRLYLRALGEASLTQDRAAAATLQLAAARAAAERSAARWEAAEGANAALTLALSRRGETAAGHAAERLSLQAQRVGTLQQQLGSALECLAGARSAADAAKSAAAAQRARGDALEALLEASRAEAGALRAQAAAAAMEAAGTAGAAAGAGPEEAVKARDLEVMRYFDRRLAAMLGAGGEAGGAKALTREVRRPWAHDVGRGGGRGALLAPGLAHSASAAAPVSGP
jgi:hypothetical protein